MSSAKGRTFTGCWPCRLKKRRCDEHKPQCSLCQRHGDRCCYDVKLVWLDDNLYKNAHGRYSSLAQLAGSHRRRRMSKKDLRSLICGSISPNNELDEDRSDSDSYTISVRRLKIYDNAVESVYGRGKRRNYNQRHVNWVLDQLLRGLESGSCKAVHKQGPFALFDAKSLAKVPSRVEVVEPSAAQAYVNRWVDEEFGTLLWLQEQDSILSNEPFREWYLEYMKRNLSLEFCHAMQERDALTCIKKRFVQWLPIALTIMVVIQGYTDELASELTAWILAQEALETWMLPTVSALVVYSQCDQVLWRCSKLLGSCSLTPEVQFLELQIAGQFVDQWRNKTMAKLCQRQDISAPYPQLKFWQTQLDRLHSIPI